MIRFRMFMLLSLFLVLQGSLVWGFVPDQHHLFRHGQAAHEYRENPEFEQRMLKTLPVQDFFKRYGPNWQIWWNEQTSTPAMVMGEGIPLNITPFDTKETVLDKLQRFIETNRHFLGIDPSELRLQAISLNRDIWHVDFARYYRGVPVYNSRAWFRIKFGRLVLFGAEAYPGINISIQPSINRIDALNRLAAVIRFDNKGSKLVQAGDLVVYPDRGSDRLNYRLAWQLEIHSGRPFGHFVGVVDANSGEVIDIYDTIMYGFQGNVQTKVDLRTINDPIVMENLPYNLLKLNSTDIVTDQDGNWQMDGTGSANVTGTLAGPRGFVYNYSGSNAQAAYQVSAGTPAMFVWDDPNSDIAERDTFRAIVIGKSLMESVFPDNRWIPTQLAANVNLAMVCNAYWDGYSINFFQAGSMAYNGIYMDCSNTGRILDIILHEMGHGFDSNDNSGATSGALGEFIGDLIAFTYTGSALMGPYFETNGNPARNLETDLTYPNNLTGEVHDDGQVLGSTVWDVRKALVDDGVSGQDLTNIMLLPIYSATQLTGWYNAMLLADDNDGNLSNGTPHGCMIWDTFNAHSSSPSGDNRWPIGTRVPCNNPKGSLVFNKSSYACSSDVEIRLRDSNLIGRGSFGISVVSSREPAGEQITLTEKNGSYGLFSGTIQIADVNSVSGDGQLSVSPDDTISASYWDEDDGLGQKVEVIARAGIDCLAPMIADVAVKEITAQSGVLEFSVNEPSRVRVFYGTASLNFEKMIDNYKTSHSILLDNLSPQGAVYLYDIQVEDIAGNLNRDDHNGEHFRFSNFPPRLSLTPPALQLTLKPGDVVTKSFFIGNQSSDRDLDFTLQKSALSQGDSTGISQTNGSGGPDQYGYVFYDDSHPEGPVQEYIDIAQKENQLPADGSDLVTGPYEIGFDFPFYDKTYHQVWIDSNGLILFSSTESAYTNSTIPAADLPNNFIAVFWDDMMVRRTRKSSVYFKQDGDRLIISFDQVHEEGEPSGSYRFQAILSSDGQVVLNYDRMGSQLSWATVGMEHESGAMGLLIAYNEEYIHPRMSILIKPVNPWLQGLPLQDRITPRTEKEYQVMIDSKGLTQGDHSSLLVLKSNDPLASALTVPVVLHVGSVDQAVLEVNATALAFTLEESQAVLPQEITLTSSSSSLALHWTASTDQTWLHLAQPDGDTPSRLAVDIDSSSLGRSGSPYNANITFTAANGAGNSVTLPVTVDILKAGNQAPLAVASIPSSGTINSPVALDASQSSDPDGDKLHYSWIQVDGPLSVTIANPTAAVTSFTTPVSGQYSFTLTVSDGLLSNTSEPVLVGVYGADVRCATLNVRTPANLWLGLLPLGLLCLMRRRFLA
jgi:hypothetical protein